MEDVYGYVRHEEPYSYEVRDRRVRFAREPQAVDGLQTSAAFEPTQSGARAKPRRVASSIAETA